MRDRLYALRVFWIDAAILILSTLLLISALCLPLCAAAEPAYTPEEAALLRALERGEIVRLHVLADGDDDESQRVKLAVRDAIIAAYGDTLISGGGRSADAAYEAIEQSLDGISAVARECARLNGFMGEVTAEAGVFALPAKRYGRVVLPEGEYRALRVTLGSGEGRNWWCVLFPRLCLAVAGDDSIGAGGAPQVVWDIPRILRLWTAMEV